jgi:hypothetical protein
MEPRAAMGGEFLFRNDAEVEYLKLCLDITIYWVGSVFDIAEGVIDFFEQSMEVVGKDTKYFETETMGGARPVRPDTMSLIPFWFAKTKSRRSIYMLFLESGPKPDLPSDKAFSLRAIEAMRDPPVGAVRLILPVATIGQSATAFIELAKRLVRKLKFASGHGGYSVNWNETGDFGFDAEQKMFQLSHRYPGIDLPSFTCTLHDIHTGFKRVNWLTFLGADLVEDLGDDLAPLRATKSPIVVHDLPHGLMIQAGPRPETGDVNRRQFLPLYREVGRAIASARMPNHPAFLMNGSAYDEDASAAWLSRFDR